jgi:signal transduction histidine kinase
MRALLLELRPSALADERLGDLIRQLAMIIAKRAGLQISIKVREQEALPPEVHFILYRVVQEALNNIAHHALASTIKLYFNSVGGQVNISVEDDGLGFDPLGVEPGHLGLNIMKDRIENIGGTFEIISQKGKGTRINVQWIAPMSDETMV